MKKFQCSLALKIVAFVLAVTAGVAAGISGLALIYGTDQGMYGTTIHYANGVRTESDGTFYTTTACRRLANWYMWNITQLYNDGGVPTEAYDKDYYNFDFILRESDENGKILATSVREGAVYGYSTSDIHGYETEAQPQKQYYVELKVTDPLQDPDEFFMADQLFHVMLQIEPYLGPVLIGGLILLLICIIFLCCAAGHRPGREEIVRNGLDKIPLDIYAAALVVLAVMPIAVGLDWLFVYQNYYDVWLKVLLLCIGTAVVGTLGLGLLLSFATRVKAGKFWRNTLVYRVAMWLLRSGKRVWHCLGRMVHALPMIWRAAIVVPVALLVEIWLVIAAQMDSVGAFVCLVYNFALLLAICFGLWQLRKLQQSGKELAGGNFDYKTDTKRMYWDFKKHAENLNSIGDGMSIAIEQRMRSERLKTELITNVSHDIKTPLTSIVNYVDLLQKPHSQEEGREYLAVLSRQSARLKKLTEDLVEASKASTGNVSANLVRTNVVEIVNQALGEYAERLAAGNLTVLTDMPEKEVAVLADGRLLWRIMDNLLSNVCKYALSGTRVYVSVRRDGETVIAVKNISREPLNVTADELMERFVRGDTARTTEGSGLGLNIARSLTQLQGGTFELFVDGDFFKAEVRFQSL